MEILAEKWKSWNETNRTHTNEKYSESKPFNDALNNWLNRAEEKLTNNIQRKKNVQNETQITEGDITKQKVRKHRKRVKKENYIK